MNQTLNHTSASKPILESLPLEIAQAILASLDDIFSLISAALTCPFLFNALRNAEETITTQVLINQLSPELVHDAIIVQESSSYKKGGRSHDQVIELIDRYIDGMREASPPSLRWKLSDALPLAEFHDKVQYLSYDLASRVLSKHPIRSKPEPKSTSSSRGEISRIDRTLYRLEIYCNLFWNRSAHSYEECNRQNLAFFSRFSPWENEQLACIRDYIFKILGPVFKQAAMDDLNWLIYFINSQPLNTNFLEHQLHHGISHIIHLLSSQPKFHLHFPAADPSSPQPNQRPRPTVNFLSTDLENVYVDRERYERFDLSKRLLAVYDHTDEAQFIPSPIIPDPDSGPEEVWRWAHDLQPVKYFVAAYGQAPLRGWGYVFWDKERLDWWDVFGRDWEGVGFEEVVDEEARGDREFEERLERRARRAGIQIKEMRAR